MACKRLTLLLVLLAGSLLVGGLRFAVPGHGLSWPGTYEAFAHIWVGVLLVYCFKREPIDVRREAWTLLAVITVIETILFLAIP